MSASPIAVRHDVAQALAAGRPVVALESSILAHGLPRPANLAAAVDIEATVRAHGALPATIGVVAGRLVVGLDEPELTRLTSTAVAKLGVRDLAAALVLGVDGATTVASAAAVAARVGISLLATGGLGGVHRGARASWDESADLVTLASTPVTVVCSGVKSILDVPATLERLESLSVTVLGYRTDRFPNFFLTDSGHPLDWRVESPHQVAALMAARVALGIGAAAIVVAHPLPVEDQLDPALHDRALAAALAAAEADGVRGKDVTPYVIDRLHHETGGRSLQVNLRIILRNAALAAQIAAAVRGPTSAEAPDAKVRT